MVTLILTDRKLKPTKAGQLSQISPMVSRVGTDRTQVRRRCGVGGKSFARRRSPMESPGTLAAAQPVICLIAEEV